MNEQKLKKAFITGASEGIGRALSLRLAKDGYAVTAVARTESRLKELVIELEKISSAPKKIQHELLVADLSTDQGRAIAQAELKKNKFDVLINNAGFGLFGKFEEIALEKQIEMINLNVITTVSLSHTFMNNADKGAAIVNLSSVASFMAMPAANVYAATKAFITSFSEALSVEASQKGIHVMNLCPGFTESKFQERSNWMNGNGFPKILTQTAEEVADQTANALKEHRESTLVTGGLNKTFVFMTRVLPRKLVAKVNSKF